MARTTRKGLIEKLQTARGGRLLITYITSTRPGYEIQIADDAFRLIYDHLEAGKELAENGVDLFIHSNGGSGTVPWRMVSLIRQYTTKFSVIVPHHAFSAATLIALGADEIIMHKMGCLGPIDPSVANIFNPPHPFIPGQPAPITSPVRIEPVATITSWPVAVATPIMREGFITETGILVAS